MGMITGSQYKFIRVSVWAIVTRLREENPNLTPGEVYDAIAQELERRCKSVIEKGANAE